jgi:hypothetical protein
MANYSAIFFDTSSQDDLDLLHSSVRSDSELDNVVNEVEYQILDYYKQRPSVPLRLQTGRENLYTTNEISVRLIDYDDDNPSNSPQELKDALKRTIAEVTSWVIRNYDNPQGNVKSIGQGERSIEFMGAAPSWQKWPDGWRRWLKNFDDREALYSI